MVAQRVVVLDNGGCTCKIGFAGEEEPLKVFPNAGGKVKGQRSALIGDQILDCQDISSLSLRRPIDRGFIVNIDMQRDIWTRAFRSVLRVKPCDCGLVLTEPLFNLPAIRDSMAQVLFEDMGFQSVMTTSAANLALRKQWHRTPSALASQAGCGLVLDAGYSATHAIPVFDGNILYSGVRRLNLGGKVLTNYLKELVSYRSINMMEETFLVEHIKEAVCFVSRDLRADLAASKPRSSPHNIEYVLPDGVNNLRGFARPPQPRTQPPADGQGKGKEKTAEQVLALNNERFTVPELLFHPSDIALKQAGVAELVMEAAQGVHPDLQQLLYSNILLVGGTTRCPGFKERLEAELRSLVPDHFDISVHGPTDPVTCAWQGGSVLGTTMEYANFSMSRHQYYEEGPGRLFFG